MNIRIIQKAILEILNDVRDLEVAIPGSRSGPAKTKHKHNFIGKSGQSGDIEYHLNVLFSETDRQLAGRAFEELKQNGYIEPTYDDISDPDNWVMITDLGRGWLKSDLRDHIDDCLGEISEHLSELRKGMWDALGRSSPDSYRHAVSSARELIDQVLKEGSPGLKTRQERARSIMEHFRGSVSKSDVKLIDAHFDVTVGEHNKLINLAHSRGSVEKNDAQAGVESAERILKLLFGSGN